MGLGHRSETCHRLEYVNFNNVTSIGINLEFAMGKSSHWQGLNFDLFQACVTDLGNEFGTAKQKCKFNVSRLTGLEHKLGYCLVFELTCELRLSLVLGII